MNRCEHQLRPLRPLRHRRGNQSPSARLNLRTPTDEQPWIIISAIFLRKNSGSLFCWWRGGGLLLSTLDWTLIETWKDAGVPLVAVLRGIDLLHKYEQRPSKTQKVNSLTYCAQGGPGQLRKI